MNNDAATAFEVFDSTIQAKRFILYATYSLALLSWETHEDLGRQADELKRDCKPQPHDLTIQQTATLATAQDLANAFVLIVDYSLRRFWKAAGRKFTHYRSTGIEAYPGTSVRLNNAFMALADQVRHLEETLETGRLKKRENQEAFEALGLDQSHDSAPCLFLVNMNGALHNYQAVEQRIISNARTAVDEAKGSL